MRRFLQSSRRAWAVFFMLTFLFYATACARADGGGGRCFSYLDAPFEAEFQGATDGEKTVFRLSAAAAPSVGSASRAVPDFTLTFEAPDALRGITVTYRAADGSYVAALDEAEIAGDFSRLCAPAIAFLTEGAVASSTAGDGCVSYRTEGGVTFTVGNSGTPRAFRGVFGGRALEYDVVWWESDEK